MTNAAFELGDDVRYIRGYRGCFLAEVVGYDGDWLVIEFYSGLRITVHPSELETMEWSENKEATA